MTQRTAVWLGGLLVLTLAAGLAGCGAGSEALPSGLLTGGGGNFSIATTAIEDGIIDRSYSKTLQTTGGTQPVASCAVTAGALPAGLSVAPSGTTCVVSGTPTVSGTFSFTITATDSGNPPLTAMQAYTLIIRAEFSVISITGVTGALPLANRAPDGVQNRAYDFTVRYTANTVTGSDDIGKSGEFGNGPITDCTNVAVTGLPAGLAATDSNFTSNSCDIRLMGTITDVPGTYNITVTMLDSPIPGSNVPAKNIPSAILLTLVVNMPMTLTLNFDNAGLVPEGVRGRTYGDGVTSCGGFGTCTPLQFVVTGGLGPTSQPASTYSWTITSGGVSATNITTNIVCTQTTTTDTGDTFSCGSATPLTGADASLTTFTVQVTDDASNTNLAVASASLNTDVNGHTQHTLAVNDALALVVDIGDGVKLPDGVEGRPWGSGGGCFDGANFVACTPATYTATGGLGKPTGTPNYIFIDTGFPAGISCTQGTNPNANQTVCSAPVDIGAAGFYPGAEVEVDDFDNETTSSGSNSGTTDTVARDITVFDPMALEFSQVQNTVQVFDPATLLDGVTDRTYGVINASAGGPRYIVTGGLGQGDATRYRWCYPSSTYPAAFTPSPISTNCASPTTGLGATLTFQANAPIAVGTTMNIVLRVNDRGNRTTPTGFLNSAATQLTIFDTFTLTFTQSQNSVIVTNPATLNDGVTDRSYGVIGGAPTYDADGGLSTVNTNNYAWCYPASTYPATFQPVISNNCAAPTNTLGDTLTFGDISLAIAVGTTMGIQVQVQDPANDAVPGATLTSAATQLTINDVILLSASINMVAFADGVAVPDGVNTRSYGDPAVLTCGGACTPIVYDATGGLGGYIFTPSGFPGGITLNALDADTTRAFTNATVITDTAGMTYVTIVQVDDTANDSTPSGFDTDTHNLSLRNEYSLLVTDTEIVDAIEARPYANMGETDLENVDPGTDVGQTGEFGNGPLDAVNGCLVDVGNPAPDGIFAAMETHVASGTTIFVSPDAGEPGDCDIGATVGALAGGSTITFAVRSTDNVIGTVVPADIQTKTFTLFVRDEAVWVTSGVVNGVEGRNWTKLIESTLADVAGADDVDESEAGNGPATTCDISIDGFDGDGMETSAGGSVLATVTGGGILAAAGSCSVSSMPLNAAEGGNTIMFQMRVVDNSIDRTRLDTGGMITVVPATGGIGSATYNLFVRDEAEVDLASSNCTANDCPDAIVNGNYSLMLVRLAGTGGDVSVTWAEGASTFATDANCGGFALAADGTISAMPATGTAGECDFSVIVSDSGITQNTEVDHPGGAFPQTLTVAAAGQSPDTMLNITVAAALAFSLTTVDDGMTTPCTAGDPTTHFIDNPANTFVGEIFGVVGRTYGGAGTGQCDLLFTATGGRPPYSWTVTGGPQVDDGGPGLLADYCVQETITNTNDALRCNSGGFPLLAQLSALNPDVSDTGNVASASFTQMSDDQGHPAHSIFVNPEFTAIDMVPDKADVDPINYTVFDALDGVNSRSYGDIGSPLMFTVTSGQGIGPNVWTPDEATVAGSSAAAGFPADLTCTQALDTELDCSTGGSVITDPAATYTPAVSLVDTANDTTPDCAAATSCPSFMASLVVNTEILVNNTYLQYGVVGLPYREIFDSNRGGTGNPGAAEALYTWSLSSGAVPGLAFTAAGANDDPALGFFTGTPTTASPSSAGYDIDVTVTDDGNATTPSCSAAGTCPIASFFGGARPFGTSVVIADNVGYTANFLFDSATRFDASTGTAGVTIPLDTDMPNPELPESVALTPDGRFAYVTKVGTNDVSAIDNIDTATGFPTDLAADSIPVGAVPIGIAINPQIVDPALSPIPLYDGLVGNFGDNTVQTITVAEDPTLASGAGTAGVTGPNQVFHEINREFGYVVTNDAMDTFVSVDTSAHATGTPVAIDTLDLGAFAIGQPGIDPRGHVAYVARNDGTVGNVAVVSITVPAAMMEITAIPAAAMALCTAGNPNGAVTSPDATRLYILCQTDNQVQVWNISNGIPQVGGVTTALPVAIVTLTGCTAGQANRLAVNADGSLLFVSCQGDNLVVVVNTATNMVAGTFATGMGPLGVAAVSNPPVEIVSTTLPAATGGMAYSAFIVARGGIIPRTWSEVTGFALADDADCMGLALTAATGEISGTPAASGGAVCSFTIRVTDNTAVDGLNPAQYVDRAFTITVN